jgi:hypothetical protein
MSAYSDYNAGLITREELKQEVMYENRRDEYLWKRGRCTERAWTERRSKTNGRYKCHRARHEDAENLPVMPAT